MSRKSNESRASRTAGSASPPIFFVSSVVDGFREYREAARQGVEAAGGRALLINEDTPALATSSRNACLDGVEKSDYVLSIVGARGGWRTPSGLLVVEEEVEHARKRNVPVLAFLQETTRDPDAERFARNLSDYVNGLFRTTFRTPDELKALVERAARERINMGPTNIEEPDLTPLLEPNERGANGETLLRYALEPARKGEVVHPVRLASPEFEHQVYVIGHAADVALFDYRHGKSADLGESELVIVQEHPGRRREEHQFVRLVIAETGALVIDANVTGRVVRGTQGNMIDAMTVVTADIEGVLRSCFRFVRAFYDAVDAHHRHERFFYNVAISQLGYRRLVRNPHDERVGGFNGGGDEPVIAFKNSRAVSRAALSESKDEIARVVTTFERLTRDR
jgi:hypothetical protein